jgi:polyisoprenoid-binding protein YceI
MKLMKITNLLIVFLSFISASFSQERLADKNASIVFSAGTSLEEIRGTSNTGVIALNSVTGEIQSTVLVKSLNFKKALMGEHFNENYIESDKFPKANFKGKIIDFSKLNLAKDGVYTVNLQGDLTLHGVTKPIKTPAKFTVKGKKVVAETDFKILIADFNIAIPGAVKDKISKDAIIMVKGNLEKI